MTAKIVVGMSFALAAKGFMIPSTLSMPDVKGDGASLLVTPQAPEHNSRTVELPCDSCDKSPGSKIVLSFDTSEDRHSLAVNDHTFFPRPDHTTPLTASLSASESFASPLSYNAGFRGVPASDGTEAFLTDIDLSITGFGNQKVSLDPLTVRVLQDEQGLVSIVDIIQGADGEQPHQVADEKNDDLAIEKPEDFEQEEDLFFIQPIEDLGQVEAINEHADQPEIEMACPSHVPPVICRLRAFFASKAATLRAEKPPMRRPCPGMLKALGRPMSKVHGGVPKFVGQLEEQGRDRWHHRGHHHRHHSKAQHVLHAIHRIIVGFIVPVMIGIAAGMTASLLGMVVGTAIAWVWIRVVRGGRRGNASSRVQLQESDADVEEHDEKKGLMANQETDEEESLPAYTE